MNNNDKFENENSVAVSEENSKALHADVYREYFTPEVDVFEYEDSILLVANVPGADSDSTDVTVEQNLLTIEAKVENESPEGYHRYYMENEAGGYRRQFRLPDDIDRDTISASVKNGVLRITLQKAEEKKLKKISVKSS